MHRAILISAAFCGCAHEPTVQPVTEPAPAPTPAPAPAGGGEHGRPMPVAAPEMAQMDYYLGTWTCDVTAVALCHIPARTYQSTITTQSDLGGSWVSIRNHSAGVTVAGFSGYDRASKHFLRVAFDSYGGMESKTSDGWKGDDWEWIGTSTICGKDLPMRHTITKHGDKEFAGKYELEIDGQWTVSRSELCKR
jgi:hypothetical protein